jgi:chromosome segregation ATPase
MAQGFADIRKETSQKFENLEQRMMAEFQATRSDMVKYYSQLDKDSKADKAELRREYSQLLTNMDPMTRNYQQFVRDRDIIDAEHQDLKRDVDTLKKRDMEKAAAIEKIEKDLDKLKAA